MEHRVDEVKCNVFRDNSTFTSTGLLVYIGVRDIRVRWTFRRWQWLQLPIAGCINQSILFLTFSIIPATGACRFVPTRSVFGSCTSAYLFGSCSSAYLLGSCSSATSRYREGKLCFNRTKTTIFPPVNNRFRLIVSNAGYPRARSTTASTVQSSTTISFSSTTRNKNYQGKVYAV